MLAQGQPSSLVLGLKGSQLARLFCSQLHGAIMRGQGQGHALPREL